MAKVEELLEEEFELKKERMKKSVDRVTANALQYSKKMSKFICWIWALYRFGVLIASTFRPSAAEPLASTLANLDWIMLVNEGTYLINSLGEKYIFSDKFILKWVEKGGFKNVITHFGLMDNAIKTQEEQVDESIECEVTEDEIGGEYDGDNNNG